MAAKHQQTQAEWLAERGRRAMELTRSELYLDLRYLNAALGALELTQDELTLLRRFAQLPFLPIAQRMDGAAVCLEEGEARARALGDAAELLSSRGLAALDYDLPLTGFDYAPYGKAPRRGSMALTARGLAVLEMMEIQGIEGE